MEKQKISPARIFLLLSIIFSVGTILGLLSAAGIISKINLPIAVNPAVDARCSQKVKFSDTSKCPLSRIINGYEFDSVGKCKEVKVYGGCSFETPFNSLEECQKTCETNFINPIKEEVVISTDKTEYEQGEIIKIVVNNGLNKPVLYSRAEGQFWSIEYFEDGRWVNPYSKKSGDFQLTEKNIGDACYIALYERSFPEELTSQSNLTAEWNQKICPFGTEGFDKPKIVEYIESGKYRLVFYYGFKISSNDPFIISESKAVYSNEFTIKEKTAMYSNYGEVPDKYSDGSYSVKGFINNAKNLDNTSFVLKGMVVNKNECAPCPAGAMCAPCAPPHIFITDYVVKTDDKYSVIVNFGRDQDTVDKLKMGDNIEIYASYNASGDGLTGENVSGSLGFLGFLKEKTAIDFYSCIQNSDCVSIKADCCGCAAGGKATSVNKAYQSEWLDNLDCKDIMCPAVMSGDPSCISKEPKCENNKCALK